MLNELQSITIISSAHTIQFANEPGEETLSAFTCGFGVGFFAPAKYRETHACINTKINTATKTVHAQKHN